MTHFGHYALALLASIPFNAPAMEQDNHLASQETLCCIREALTQAENMVVQIINHQKLCKISPTVIQLRRMYNEIEKEYPKGSIRPLLAAGNEHTIFMTSQATANPTSILMHQIKPLKVAIAMSYLNAQGLPTTNHTIFAAIPIYDAKKELIDPNTLAKKIIEHAEQKYLAKAQFTPAYFKAGVPVYAKRVHKEIKSIKSSKKRTANLISNDNSIVTQNAANPIIGGTPIRTEHLFPAGAYEVELICHEEKPDECIVWANLADGQRISTTFERQPHWWNPVHEEPPLEHE